GWITKFTNDFVNSAALKAQKEAGVSRKLVGFEMIDKGIPRHGYSIENASGEKIGTVTSGSPSPSLGISIGLGYVAKDYTAPGTEIFIEIRGKKLKARVVKIPFHKK